MIAEHKRRSPSAGTIREGLEIEDVVSAYERGGAAALSVLTEQVGFGGTPTSAAGARGGDVADPALDFCRRSLPGGRVDGRRRRRDPADRGRAAPDELAALYAQAQGFGLGVLVEVHDAPELAVAADLRPEVIGINNRDLTTLEVDTERTHELLAEVPAGTTVVSESGLRTREDLERLAAAGVDAVLVGEALMRSPDVEAACRELTGLPFV